MEVNSIICTKKQRKNWEAGLLKDAYTISVDGCADNGAADILELSTY